MSDLFPMPRVAVVVLTYRRPETLVGGLPELARQVGALGGRVVVVDNDPEASAREAVERFNESTVDVDVIHVHEPVPGIAAARRRAMLIAAPDELVAFIDDDEKAAPGWLGLLVGTWAAHGRPAAVAGRVVPRYTADPPQWIVDGGFFVRRSLPTGTQVDAAGAGNLLLDVAQVRSLGIEFDAALGLRGGEDTLFTRQLTQAGGRIVWCEEAQAFDLVPPERMTSPWVYRRAFSHGSAHGMVSLAIADGTLARAGQRVVLVAGGLARVILGLTRWVVGTLCRNDRMRVRGCALAHRGLGIASAGSGQRHEEYKRDEDVADAGG